MGSAEAIETFQARYGRPREQEVGQLSEAEVRSGYSTADGSSASAVGRDVLKVPLNEPTTVYGWDLTSRYGSGTALHELGHMLGMEHEQQNSFAGIKWHEQAVYHALPSLPMGSRVVPAAQGAAAHPPAVPGGDPRPRRGSAGRLRDQAHVLLEIHDRDEGGVGHAARAVRLRLYYPGQTGKTSLTYS